VTEELSLPDGVQWGDWGPPKRVRIDLAPLALFARAVRDSSPIYRSERAAAQAGFAAVPVPPTFSFVMADSCAFDDLQPEVEGEKPPAFDFANMAKGFYLHGNQEFVYHRWPKVGDELESRLRVSEPIHRLAKRGPMQVTYMHTQWRDTATDEPVVDELITSLYFPS